MPHPQPCHWELGDIRCFPSHCPSPGTAFPRLSPSLEEKQDGGAGGRFSGNRISLQILPMQEHSGTLSLVALTLLGGGVGKGTVPQCSRQCPCSILIQSDPSHASRNQKTPGKAGSVPRVGRRDAGYSGHPKLPPYPFRAMVCPPGYAVTPNILGAISTSVPCSGSPQCPHHHCPLHRDTRSLVAASSPHSKEQTAPSLAPCKVA